MLIAELDAAGINHLRVSAKQPYSCIVGNLCGWTFKRSWHFWIATGDGLPLEYHIETPEKLKELADFLKHRGKVIFESKIYD